MIDNIRDLEDGLEKLSSFISREKGKEEQILNQLNKYKKNSDELHHRIEVLDKVIILYQKTAEFARDQAKEQIENLVTKCLQFIFESDMKFIIEIGNLRNKASASFYIENKVDGLTITNKPELARGGGIVDIISLALRIAFLEIHKPVIEGPLILDEPAKHVSEDYIFNVGDFLNYSCDMFNRQIIMVTHNQHLSALSNNSYRVDLEGSQSVVTAIEL
ncbi:MAG TPA: ATPase [Tissierellaceae bacterium]|nr:ATPase [Tissierellaceae bacterium]